VCELSIIFSFTVAHVVAWSALGGTWRAAGRAPFAVIAPAVALLLLNAVFFDSYGNLPLQLGTLIAWEAMYFFCYVTLRVALRPGSAEAPASPEA
jgi:hypothetical protein